MTGKKHIRDYNRKTLYKFLESKVGQNWDKVYSEICNFVGYNSVNGRSFRNQIDWIVDRNIFFIGGKPYTTYNPYHGLYVDPNTRLLCSIKKPLYKRKKPKLEKIYWKGNLWFVLEVFKTKAKCGCVHFRFPPKTEKEYYHSHNSDATCIHGNLPIPREIWYVVDYGFHSEDEIYKIFVFDCCFPDRNNLYGLKEIGDKKVIYYRDVPDIDRKYIIRKKQANHKELKELRKLLNKE